MDEATSLLDYYLAEFNRRHGYDLGKGVRLRVGSDGTLELDPPEAAEDQQLGAVIAETRPVLERARVIRQGVWFPAELPPLCGRPASLWFKVGMVVDGSGPDEDAWWERNLWNVVDAIPRPIHSKRWPVVKPILDAAAAEHGWSPAEELRQRVAVALEIGLHGVDGKRPIPGVLRRWPDPRRPPTTDDVHAHLCRLATRLVGMADARPMTAAVRTRFGRAVFADAALDAPSDAPLNATLDAEDVERRLASLLTPRERSAVAAILHKDARKPLDLVGLQGISPSNASVVWHRLRVKERVIREALRSRL